jgi:hypothetical protein
MRLGSRADDDQGPTRIVIWSDGSQTDLGVIGAGLLVTCGCGTGIVVARHSDGIVRVIAVVTSAIAGLYASVILIPLVVGRCVARQVERITSGGRR